MKRYLIKGLLALVAGGFAASCADHDVDYVPLAQQKTQAYEKAFEEMIGGKVDPNQDWGFTVLPLPTEEDAAAAATRAMTRGVTRTDGVGSVIKPDMTSFPGYSNERCNSSNYRSPEGYADIVAPVTEKEAEWVQDWFSKNPGLSDEGLDISNFFVQHVSTNGKTKAGYFHSTEGGKAETVEARTYNDINMDKLQIGPEATEAGTLHALDFNATNGFNTWNLIYIKDGSALQFGYHESYGSSYKFLFKCVELEVPGSCFDDGVARKGWYVGLSYYCEKYETGEKWHIIGGDRLQYGDDWILKIVPGEGSTPSVTPSTSTSTTTTTQHIKTKVLAAQGRVFCEDLGQAGQKDIDFNDIVFDARIWYTFEFDRVTTGSNVVNQNYRDIKYEADICLLAAGGTIASKLAGRDVHDLFGVGVTTMVNTVDQHADAMTTWDNMKAEKAPITFTYDMTSIITNAGYISLDLIPVEVLWTMGKEDAGSNYGTMQSVGVLNANLGLVPHKISLPIGTVWPSERQSISDTYANFKFWATDRGSYPEFYKEEIDTDRLYTGVTTGLPLEDSNGRSYYTINDANIWTNYTAEELRSSSSYTVTETVLWEGSNTFTTNDSGGTADLTINSTSFNVGDIMRFYTSDVASNAWLTIHNDDNGWNEYTKFGPTGSYYDVTVTSTMKEMITAKVNIWGRGCTLTKITKVTTTTN